MFGAPILLPIFGRYHSTQRRFSRRLGSQAWTQPLSLQSGQMGRDSINQPSSLGNPLPPLQLLAKILKGISTVCHNLKQHWKHLQRPSAVGRSACCRLNHNQPSHCAQSVGGPGITNNCGEDLRKPIMSPWPNHVFPSNPMG